MTERSPSSAEDLQSLMRRYQQSDRDAAAALVEQLSPQLLGFFLAQVRDRSRAEDLLQDFWLRMHTARRTYRPGEPVLPWMYAIARRTQIDDFRRRMRVARHEVQTETLPEPPAASSEPHETNLPDMTTMVAGLPQSQREVVLMLKVGDLSLEEVARATGSSVGSVKQKAHRAYETLRKAFGREP